MRILTSALEASPVWTPSLGRFQFASRKWDMPERTMVLVLVIVAVTILGAIAMLPNTEEKAQVLLSQGRTGEAISLYESKGRATSLNPFEAYSLAGLYETEGRTAPLIRLLESEIVKRSESDWARDMLTSVYRAGQFRADEARILTQTFTLAPQADDFRRLIVLYRLLGDQSGELATLETARTAGLTNAADLERLTYLATNPTSSASAAIWRAPNATSPQIATLSELTQ